MPFKKHDLKKKQQGTTVGGSEILHHLRCKNPAPTSTGELRISEASTVPFAHFGSMGRFYIFT